MQEGCLTEAICESVRRTGAMHPSRGPWPFLVFWLFLRAGGRSPDRPNRPATVTVRSGADVADAEGLFDRGDFLDLA